MRSLVPAVVWIAACGSSPLVPTPVALTVASTVASNVLRGDYVGSQACEDCHQSIYDSWAKSPMRNMTRDAATAAIKAPFDGASLTVGDQTATMTKDRDGHRIVRVKTVGGIATYRVTKVIGGRYREDFVGTTGTGPELVLPATYVLSSQSWRYKGYSVMVKERPGLSMQAVWAQECIACHNTLPLATELYDELFGDEAPSYQGKLSDRVLPASRLWSARPTDAPGLVAALAAEMKFLGATPPTSTAVKDNLVAASQASEAHLDGTKLVELGIGCEACHNGAREHAAAATQHIPTFAAASAVFAVMPPKSQAGSRAQWINHTCAKCHTVLFTKYPWTWEGGTRQHDVGGSTTNSGEGRDFQLGGCSTQMACTTCHDPHDADPKGKLAALATVDGNHVCASCHQAVAANLHAHTHHQPTSAGSSCIGCHMPKKNMGLDYSLVRYHRIGSPNDPKRVKGDRPLECALCHQDQSVETLAATMERWWPRTRIDRAALRTLYGPDLAVNAIRATLALGKPHEQAVAISTLGGSGDPAAIPLVAAQLAHDYPLVRYFAKRALEQLTGAAVPVDVNLPAAQIRVVTQQWLATRPQN